MGADVVLWTLLPLSCITDITVKKIPNRLTFTAMALGLIIFAAGDGLPGLGQSLSGLALGLVLLFVPFALGGMGAGDVKLLAAVGALKGPDFVFRAFIGSALAGGALALGAIIWRRRLWACIKWLGPALASLALRLLSRGKVKLAVPAFPASGIGLPYGVAIAAGTLGTLLWG